VSGLAYVKWHIRDSPLAESRGRTSKAQIKEHRVTWHYTKELNIKMTVDKTGMLAPIFLDLEIVQEYSGRERIVLGSLELNLAEYVGRERESRRYLMQASKINSTLQIATELKQMSGETNFKVPELKPPQVFSGLAGVMMSESIVPADSGNEVASQNTQENLSYASEIGSIGVNSRERSRVQDIYRRTLAASWQLQTGELNPVDCIEDIFSGGNGWLQEKGNKDTSGQLSEYGQAGRADNEYVSRAHDLRAHRSETARFSPTGASNDQTSKRSRSFHYSDRYLQDNQSSGTLASSPRLYSTVSQKNKPITQVSRPWTQFSSRSLNATPMAASDNDNLERNPTTMLFNSSNSHSYDLVEEEIRDNLVSWSL